MSVAGGVGGTSSFSLSAPAKINLVLRVLGRREDGYHELETWMQKVDLCDTIEVKVVPNGKVHLQCKGHNLSAGEDNLLWRAARCFLDHRLVPAGVGVELVLHKRIPVAAGLGGGSSDAGSLLKGLNQHFGKPLPDDVLCEMGKMLGADVPFFTTDYSSVMATGIGEKMVEVPPLKDCTVILVNPGISVSTGTIFEKLALTRRVKNSTVTGFVKLHRETLSLDLLENDLEAVTLSLLPVIQEIKDTLLGAGAAKALMSGSGSTVFGVFSHSSAKQQEKIDNACTLMRKLYGEQVYPVKPWAGVSPSGQGTGF